MPCLSNSVDPDQLASEEANWPGSALFVIKYVDFCQKPRSSNLIGWKLEVGVAIYSARQGLMGIDTISGETFVKIIFAPSGKFSEGFGML